MRTCVIPLRAGSKRLENKNVLDFFGSPIFTYPLSTARQSGLFDKIIIACDKEYEDLVRKSVPLNTSFNTEIIIYIRDPENSKDESGLIDLVREVVSHFAIEDSIMTILYSTSVLTTPKQLIDAEKILDDYDCVFPIVFVNHELTTYQNYYVYEEDECKYQAAYHADSFFTFNTKVVLRKNKIILDENGYIKLNDYQTHAVHFKEDIDMLKIKYKIREFCKYENISW